MAGKVKTWVWVVIAVVVIGILGLIAMAGIGFYFATQHINTHEASPSAANREFDEVKKAFAAQKPLIELDDRGDFLRSNTDREAPANAKAPEALYVMAFDPDDSRVVRIRLPFWVLRLQSGNQTINFNGRRMDLEDLKLTVEDLERFGPTLIVDHKSPGGERVLVWSQ